MIPEEKNLAVTKALRETFGVAVFDEIHRIPNGTFNKVQVYRIAVQGSVYLLRIILRSEDPTCHFTCMRAAADAGLAPRVLSTSVEDRISITEFVEGAILFPRTEALVRVPRVLRALQALPRFPGRASHLNTSCTFLLQKGPGVDGILQCCRAVGVLPPGEVDELIARHAQLASVCSVPQEEMAPSHNDLFKPDNILFDGGRVWLIDWEAAFLNDRYADLAAVANMIVTSEAEEECYLAEFFAQPPDEYQRARFFLMQQVAHIFYTMAFLILQAGAEPIDWSKSAPEYHEFQRRFWTGEVKLDDLACKIACGRVHWDRVRRNAQSPRFAESIRIVSERRAAA
ncbi:MAG TPA: phosphotransferase [Bryobacteraceae bacterium]|nr:phosphotransferase [Bryobacteraceae bacterium]